MSVLDRVYTTFKRLDQDYARSKKSRTAFITDKFGGDIRTGSIIILDAIRSEGVEETPENIAKMSFVKDIFERIRDNAERLDSMTSFCSEDSNVSMHFMNVLLRSEYHGSKQKITTQSELWGASRKALHYCSTAEGIDFVEPDDCKVFKAFNENMIGLLGGAFHCNGELQLAGYYKLLAGRRIKEIQEPAVAKNLK